MDTTNIKNRFYFAFGLFAIVLIIISFFPNKWLGFAKNNEDIAVEEKQQKDLMVIQNINNGGLNDDTDGDGLKNWEEALMGTNPNVKDNPNQNKDTVSDISVVTIAKDDPLNDPNNLTAQFAKNSYTLASYLDSNGVSDSQTIDNVSKGLIDGEITKMLTKRYSESDLKTVNKNDIATLKKYGNQLATFVDASLKVSLGINEETILNTYNQSKDVNDLKKIKTKIDSLTSLQNNLKDMTVPKLAVSLHLNLLNNVTTYVTVLKNMNTADSDPIRTIAGYKALSQTLPYFYTSVYKFVDFFKTNNVIFATEDKGYLFTNNKK